MLPKDVVGPLVATQKRLRSLDDGAMPVVLALGNRMVFHEIGWTVAEFLRFLDGRYEGEEPDTFLNPADPVHFDAYCSQIQPSAADDFFRPCYPEWLREGIRSYYAAYRAKDADTKAEQVLRGNILIGAYEQWRVDSYFEVALDFNPGALVRDLRIGPHAAPGTRPVGIKHGGTRRALRHQWAAINWMSDAYAAFLTRFVLTWDAPLFSQKPSALQLGSDVPARRRTALNTNYLAELDPSVEQLFSSFDRSGGQLRGSGARNWRRFTDRMSFIVNLFRTQQQNENLKVPPSVLEERLLALTLNDEDLDELRWHGDPEQETLRGIVEIAPRAAAQDQPPADARPWSMKGELPEFDLPAWLDEDKVCKGQEFFEKHQMEIASALFSASLPMAYTAARGARALRDGSAGLEREPADRRDRSPPLQRDVARAEAAGRPVLAEITELPGRDHGPCVPTRPVRDLLHDKEPWKSEWNGRMTQSTWDVDPGDDNQEVPINQEDLLGTLATFTVVVFEALEKMGVEYTPEERDNYLHVWLVVGELLGIDYARLRKRTSAKPKTPPLTYFEMQLIRDSVFRRQAAPSPSGQVLARALLGMQESVLPRVLRPLPPAAIRRFIGDDAADMLEVPPAGPVRVALDALGPVGSATDWIAEGRLVRPRLAQMAEQMLQHWIAEEIGTPRDWSGDGIDILLGFKPELADARTTVEKAKIWKN